MCKDRPGPSINRIGNIGGRMVGGKQKFPFKRKTYFLLLQVSGKTLYKCVDPLNTRFCVCV